MRDSLFRILGILATPISTTALRCFPDPLETCLNHVRYPIQLRRLISRYHLKGSRDRRNRTLDGVYFSRYFAALHISHSLSQFSDVCAVSVKFCVFVRQFVIYTLNFARFKLVRRSPSISRKRHVAVLHIRARIER